MITDIDSAAPVLDVPPELTVLRKNFGQGVQKRIDKAVSRQREAERQRGAILRDLMDTVHVCRQLLERCKDKLDTQDQVAILDGLAAIEREHKNAGR